MDEYRKFFESSLQHAQSLGVEELSVSLEAAISAGFFIFNGWNGTLEDLEVKEKGVGDLVSAVDLKAEEHILEKIQKKFPDDLVLSEETMQTTRACPGKRMWIIDPLDGTSCFVFRVSSDLVSVLIALYDCDEQKVTVALELFPIQKRAVYALLGKGAFCDGKAIKINEAAKVPLSKAWVNLNHYSDVTFESEAFVRARQMLRSPGKTAARMVTNFPATSGVACQLIFGRMSAILHDNDVRSVKQGPWDTAAPQLIIEEAGGLFLNGKTGQRYDTLSPDLVLIAATKELAEEILHITKGNN